MQDLIKKFGQDAFITGDQLEQYTNETISVSPRLDLILGGGIPGGSVVTLAGKPKCGKSVTALHILGKAQQLGRPTYYLNVEGRIKPRDINGIKCLDPTKLTIVRSYRGEDGTSRILKADEFLQVAEHIAHNVTGAVIVIDSISQLLTSGEAEGELGKQDRAPGAVLMAKFCKRLSNVVPVNDVVVIGILHVVANTGGYGKATFVSGGNKIQFAMDVGLECKGFKIIREGDSDDSRPMGQEVEWITTSTAFVAPGQKTTSRITYGIGIDELYEMIEVGIECGCIQQSHTWYELVYMHEQEGYAGGKVQGKEKLVSRLRDNDVERDVLTKTLREMMGFTAL